MTARATDFLFASKVKSIWGIVQKQNFKAFEFVDSEKAEALKTAKFKLVSVTQS